MALFLLAAGAIAAVLLRQQLNDMDDEE